MTGKKIHIVFGAMIIVLMVAAPSRPCMSSFLGAGPKVGEGDSLPPFATKDLKGNDINLADHLGRDVILLDFWSIYCAPCVKEMPTLIELYDKYNKMGLEVFGISLDSRFNARRLTKFVEGFEHRIPYPIIHDAQAEIRRTYGVGTLPTTIIVDASGKVQMFHIGFTQEDKQMIANFVARLLSEREGNASLSGSTP